MRRRGFLALAGACAAAGLPLGVRAQQKMPRIALVTGAFPVTSLTATGDPTWAAFIQELARLGFVEGKTVLFDRYLVPAISAPEMMASIVASRPDLVFLNGAVPAAMAVKGLTQTIPIVTTAGDPVTQGLVTNFAHPGENIAVVANGGVDFEAKNLALLAEALPQARRVAYTQTGINGQVNASQKGYLDAVSAEAPKLGLTLVPIIIESPGEEADVRRSFAAVLQNKVDAMDVGFTTPNNVYSAILAQLALDAKLPSISPYLPFADQGGLLSHGVDQTGVLKQAAQYVALVLNGTKPGDLPVMQPTTFDTVVNLKTAKTFGLTIPQSVLYQATQTIS